jgi:hypothetical protein
MAVNMISRILSVLDVPRQKIVRHKALPLRVSVDWSGVTSARRAAPSPEIT